jgi:hypothetical protein
MRAKKKAVQGMQPCTAYNFSGYAREDQSQAYRFIWLSSLIMTCGFGYAIVILTEIQSCYTGRHKLY